MQKIWAKILRNKNIQFISTKFKSIFRKNYKMNMIYVPSLDNWYTPLLSKEKINEIEEIKRIKEVKKRLALLHAEEDIIAYRKRKEKEYRENHKKGNKRKIIPKEERRQANLERCRKWRLENKEKIKEYNKKRNEIKRTIFLKNQ